MARLQVERKELSEDDVQAIVDIATRQVELIDRLEAAVIADDDRAIKELARQICCLEHE